MVHKKAEQIRAAYQARRREAHARAAARWGEGDPGTRQRTAMVIAAFILNEKDEPELADWLLCARPEHARAIATGVAAHALRRGVTAAWDALAAVDAMDVNEASESFESKGDFAWCPEPGWLYSATPPVGDTP